MSLLATLALMSTALVAKVREIKDDPRDVEIRTLKARVDDLERELNEAKTVAVALGRDRDDWRRNAEGWREQAYGRQDQAIQQAHAILNQLHPAMQSAQMLQAQANQQIAAMNYQNAQNQQPFYGLGATQSLEEICNCVPARHDLLLRG